MAARRKNAKTNTALFIFIYNILEEIRSEIYLREAKKTSFAIITALLFCSSSLKGLRTATMLPCGEVMISSFLLNPCALRPRMLLKKCCVSAVYCLCLFKILQSVKRLKQVSNNYFFQNQFPVCEKVNKCLRSFLQL